MSIKVMLADDHPIVRQGLHRLLESEPDFTVIAEAGDGLEALEMVMRTRPDVLIIDLMMPGLNGLEVTRQVMQSMPELRVIVLSMHQDEAYVLQALRSGAKGYVLKDSNPKELTQAIREVVGGARYLSEALSIRQIEALLEKANQAESLDSYQLLSSRERSVLQLLVEGNTNGEAAQRLSISQRTVEAHRASIMHKLSLNNQVELIRFAIKRGILKLDS